MGQRGGAVSGTGAGARAAVLSVLIAPLDVLVTVESAVLAVAAPERCDQRYHATIATTMSRRRSSGHIRDRSFR
jgi:hypothetical protein